jgi:hypothetical protein
MRKVLTFSMLNKFRNCRKACYWRYIKELEPLTKSHALFFGSVIHECLEIWHSIKTGGAATLAVACFINKTYPERDNDEQQLKDWHLAAAMMRGYIVEYGHEPFEVIALEQTFEGSITNPETGAPSKSFILSGKVDGIVKQDGQYFLLEHKTTSSIDGSYIERLWLDFQITLYAHYIEKTMGIKIAGIIYNILVKARLRQSKNESNEAFQERLAAKYQEPGMFHRETIYITNEMFGELTAELWELTKQLLDCRKKGMYYRNTAQCFQWNRACPYLALCRSNGSQLVIDSSYKKVEPHQELKDTPPLF